MTKGKSTHVQFAYNFFPHTFHLSWTANANPADQEGHLYSVQGHWHLISCSIPSSVLCCRRKKPEIVLGECEVALEPGPDCFCMQSRNCLHTLTERGTARERSGSTQRPGMLGPGGSMLGSLATNPPLKQKANLPL